MSNFISSSVRRANQVVKEMSVWDIGLIKFACIVFGLLLAKLIPPLLTFPVWGYVLAIVVLSLPVIVRVLPKYFAPARE